MQGRKEWYASNMQVRFSTITRICRGTGEAGSLHSTQNQKQRPASALRTRETPEGHPQGVLGPSKDPQGVLGPPEGPPGYL